MRKRDNGAVKPLQVPERNTAIAQHKKRARMEEEVGTEFLLAQQIILYNNNNPNNTNNNSTPYGTEISFF